MSKKRSGEDRRENSEMGGEKSKVTPDLLEGLRKYGSTIARGYLKRPEDVADAVQDGMKKVLRCFRKGRQFSTEDELKNLFGSAVRTGAIDRVRKECGRRDKDGKVKRRLKKNEMESTAFERIPSRPSRDELRVLLAEWAELIRHEGGDQIASVFELNTYRLTAQEIADELRLELRTVQRCVRKAREIIQRHLRQE